MAVNNFGQQASHDNGRSEHKNIPTVTAARVARFVDCITSKKIATSQLSFYMYKHKCERLISKKRGRL
jgi:hypothetical protein